MRMRGMINTMINRSDIKPLWEHSGRGAATLTHAVQACWETSSQKGEIVDTDDSVEKLVKIKTIMIMAI